MKCKKCGGELVMFSASFGTCSHCDRAEVKRELAGDGKKSDGVIEGPHEGTETEKIYGWYDFGCEGVGSVRTDVENGRVPSFAGQDWWFRAIDPIDDPAVRRPKRYVFDRTDVVETEMSAGAVTYVRIRSGTPLVEAPEVGTQLEISAWGTPYLRLGS